MQSTLNDRTVYQSPLVRRYAGDQILKLFSEKHRIQLWRKLWVALAKGEMKLGLSITAEQVQEMENAIDNIDFDRAEAIENETHHDVMAHILAYGEKCPNAKGIIHLGATSCYVTDNADLLIIKEALELVKEKLGNCINSLKNFAKKTADIPCLALTHFQPASPTTVGKRACLWLQDFIFDLNEIQFRLERFYFLGIKGATGTQSSLLELFKGDHEKVKALEDFIAKEMGFSKIFRITGQTYPRKQDVFIFNTLAALAASAHKCSTDLRLLAGLNEVQEFFGSSQVGSSAMPHKKNPIHLERISSLSRFVISLAQNPLYTASLQWFERTLDDSANRRLVIAESFLSMDAILTLLNNAIEKLVLHPHVIETRLKNELPNLMMETVLMASCEKGGDRQVLHDALKTYSHQADGNPNNLFEKIAKDPRFQLSLEELNQLGSPSRLTGRAKAQVEEYLKELS